MHENGKVTGAIFTDIDGKYFQVNADAVIVAAGDFGGNPDIASGPCATPCATWHGPTARIAPT